MDLWTTASEEVEAEQHLARYTAARTATASVEPFLAASEGLVDFENRLALRLDQIDATIASIASDPADFAVLRAEVLGALTQEWSEQHTAKVSRFNRYAKLVTAGDGRWYVHTNSVRPDGSKDSFFTQSFATEAEARAYAKEAEGEGTNVEVQGPTTAASKSDVCPDCGSHMDNVEIIDGGKRLTATCANCGWKGTKTKTAAETPPQFEKKDEAAPAPEGEEKPAEAPAEGEEAPEEAPAAGEVPVGADGAPPPPAVAEKIQEANSVTEQAPVDPNAPPADPQAGENAGEKPGEEKKPDFLKKEQSFKTAEFPPKKDEGGGEGLPTEQEDQNDAGNRIDALRGVVDNKQATQIDGMLVDMTTAALLTAIFDGLNPENQAKFETIELSKLVEWAWQRTGTKQAADAVPEGCIGCIVMGGTPIVVKVGCPVHDEGKQQMGSRKHANPYTDENPYSNPSSDAQKGLRGDPEGLPDEMLDGPNDINLMKDVPAESTRPRQRPGGQPTEFNQTAPQTTTTSSLDEVEIVCMACNQQGTIKLASITDSLRCVCGSDDLDVAGESDVCSECDGSGKDWQSGGTCERCGGNGKRQASKTAFSGDLPFGHVHPEADMSVKQPVRCSNCLHEFVVNAVDPNQPLPNCPNCGSDVVSAAGATGVSPTASYGGGSPKEGDTATCHADGGKIQFFDGQWMHLKGTGSDHNDVYPASKSEAKTAEYDETPNGGGAAIKECPTCKANGTVDDNCPTCQGIGQVFARKTAADDFGPGSGGFVGVIQALWNSLRSGNGEIPSWFPKSMLLPEEIASGRFETQGGNIGSFANLDIAKTVASKIEEIAAGVQTTNPGMNREAAVEVAVKTVLKYPKVAGLQ